MIIGLIPLAACNAVPQAVTPVPTVYCPAAIHPDKASREWLHTLTPPPHAIHYFNQIANQQAFFDRGCQ